jgi:CDP-glucose 4,6-dehydratase
MKYFSDIYKGKRVLITGHTGFKGSWLALWLQEMGADVAGIALSPEYQLNHWDLLRLRIDDFRIDICNPIELQKIVNKVKPEIVFHLAAQPLVRRSYLDPLETWSVNVMGTANLLEACRKQTSVRAIVSITTDKCYENQEWTWGYREIDKLGGHDPYSASKAAAELVADSYRKSFFNTENSPLLATGRAGNVVGGGDWSEDRLIPDLIRAIEKRQSLEIRSPQASRPWQHVLESLSGYLLLGQKLLNGEKDFAAAWNFGPKLDSNKTVKEVLDKLKAYSSNVRWHVSEHKHPHEANLLFLDSTKAIYKLGWQPIWSIDTTLEKTMEWYVSWLDDAEIISRQQLSAYLEAAAFAKVEWTCS